MLFQLLLRLMFILLLFPLRLLPISFATLVMLSLLCARLSLSLGKAFLLFWSPLSGPAPLLVLLSRFLRSLVCVQVLISALPMSLKRLFRETRFTRWFIMTALLGGLTGQVLKGQGSFILLLLRAV